MKEIPNHGTEGVPDDVKNREFRSILWCNTGN